MRAHTNDIAPSMSYASCSDPEGKLILVWKDFWGAGRQSVRMDWMNRILQDKILKVQQSPTRSVVKVFWGVTILTSLIGLCLHLYYIVSNYLEYKFTESTFERRGSTRFPDVSICNIKGFSTSNLEAASKTSPRIFAILQELNKSVSLADELLHLRDYVAFAEDDAKLMGHKQEDFILSCLFNKLPCKKNDIEQFLFPSFINCFTFVRGRNSFVTSKGSADSGLRMVLYLEPENVKFTSLYSHKATFVFSTGIRILLTPSNHLRTIGNSAYEAAPGFSTSLIFDTTEHTRLPEPYNECRHMTDFTQKSEVPYSYVECRNDCLHADVIEECGCQSTGYLVRNMKNVSSCGLYLLTTKSKSHTQLNCQ